MKDPADDIKKRQLKKHKAIATGLFLLMVAVYALTTWALKNSNFIALGYIKAFAEAAMVGALADWFAVTALFHHPLGIPIPHTNLIENRKKSIGNNLGGFVVSNFLNAATLRPYIAQIKISAFITSWLGHAKNKALLCEAIGRMLKDVIQKANDEAVASFFTAKAKDLLKDAKLNEVLAAGLDIIVERGDQVRMLNYIVTKLRAYVIDNEAMVRDRVKNESHFLIPGFVDNIIAAKITNGLAKYLLEIEEDPDHKIRQELNNQLSKFISDVRHSAKWQEELNGVKEIILSGNKIEQYAGSVWKQIQTSIVNDLESAHSAIQTYLKHLIDDLSEHLNKDRPLQQKLDRWAIHTAYKFILKNTDRVGALISDTVGNWEGKELSNKLELEVGKDLQFIRINGTIVGGLMGLIIYIVTRLIENS
ncbi:DUF445 domain-containing protein [Niabella insulamsoli]|uniref:DUF445 domain-containing protein n=1 Tax=Niabella insulamsoli TaxID=3144874 RepID=UPI0031FC5816